MPHNKLRESSKCAHSNPNMGEAKPALRLLAIKKATNLRIKNIITEGDSLVVYPNAKAHNFVKL
jgi:hypothetical protein